MRLAMITLPVALLLSCDSRAEPCFYNKVDVRLSASPERGAAPLETQVVASGQGLSCGCCGGREATRLVEYRWDTDGDGQVDMAGAALTSLPIRLDAPGERTIEVTVVDSEGTMKSSSIRLIAEGQAQP